MRRALPCARDVTEIGNRVQVDEHRRHREPEVHGGNQALAAGERLGVAAMTGEQRECFTAARRTMVVERRGLHEPPCSRA